MRIFLLGAAGFIGKHLHRRLVDHHEVVIDMRYFEDRYDLIINLAAVTHIFNVFDPKLIESNFILADKIFKRPERIIYASSCSAAHFTNPYAMSKLWSEYLGNKNGNALGLRFFNVYGSGNNKGIVKFLIDQPDGATITIRGPELTRDYIHVDDVVDTIIKNLLPTYKKTVCKPGLGCRPLNFKNVGIREVGTGIATQTMDLVNLYMELSQKKFTINVVEAGENEPKEMVAKYPTLCLSLEEGLLKTINNENN